MKKNNIFWGVLLISTGLCFLLFEFDLFADSFNKFYTFWPIIFIFIGLSLFNINEILRKVFVAVSAALLGIVLISLFANISTNVNKLQETISVEIKENRQSRDKAISNYGDSFIAEYDSSFATANFNFDGGVSYFEIIGSTDKLVEIKTNNNFGSFDVSTQDSAYYVIFETDSYSGNSNDWFDNIDSERSAKANFNSKVLWDMVFNSGLTELDLDLSQLKIRNIDFETGISEVELTLGSLHKLTTLKISTGVSEFDVSVPLTSGCKIYYSGFSSTKFEGFQKLSNGEYVTENFSDAESKIIINIEGGLSSFKVRRY